MEIFDMFDAYVPVMLHILNHKLGNYDIQVIRNEVNIITSHQIIDKTMNSLKADAD